MLRVTSTTSAPQYLGKDAKNGLLSRLSRRLVYHDRGLRHMAQNQLVARTCGGWLVAAQVLPRQIGPPSDAIHALRRPTRDSQSLRQVKSQRIDDTSNTGI